jgi:hypothetical protein
VIRAKVLEIRGKLWIISIDSCYSPFVVSTPATNLRVELQKVFEVLGFYSHQTSFDRAIPYPDLRQTLSTNFPSSAVTRMLSNLPELFVLHPDMSQGIFFVKVTGGLSPEEKKAYKEFYPSDIILISIDAQNSGRRLVCCWIDLTKKQSLLAALKDRFGFTASPRSVKGLEKDGWIV